MTTTDEETIKAYTDESMEHLAHMETDLLEIEKAGSNIDENRVNKVFRAAHSIKGGAGFVGLENIKVLSHQMENVLGLMRNRKLVPDGENINFLLQASDVLRNLLAHAETSDQMDISDPVRALSSITDPPDSPPESPPPEPPARSLDPPPPDDLSAPAEWPMDPARLKEIKEAGKSVYDINIPVSRDPDNGTQTPEKIVAEAGVYGDVLAHRVDESQNLQTFKLLFACVLDLEDIASLFEITPAQVQEVFKDDHAASPVPTATPEADTPVTGATEHASGNRMETTIPIEPKKEISPKAEITRPEEQSEKRSETASPVTQPVPEPPKTATKTSLRVHVDLLDSLMALTGELVLGRNQLLQALSRGNHHASEAVGKRINLITSELQEAVMRTRMQSMGIVFNKFPRLVRDLARNLDKEVALVVEGKDVELDKTLIEAIGDPLTHLMRNAIDHGIETPQKREGAGKPRAGRIDLKAFHEAGQVNIQISDDGQGLSGDKLAAAAIEKGFITDEQARGLSDNEKTNLIFLPGFSMARTVTDVSGRGVGMDVVKTNLDRLGGQIDLNSTPGKGTTIIIKVPLTLAIIPSQIVLTEGERYAIPQVNLAELIRIPAHQVQKRIEMVGDAQVVRLRSSLLPLVRLTDLFGVQRTYMDPLNHGDEVDRRGPIADRRSRRSPLFGSRDNHETESSNASLESHPLRKAGDRRYRAASGLNIAVVSSGFMKYGLVVDALFDSEEIVVHPLGRHFKHTKGYAGATVMGDGKVALILDVMELAQLAQLSSVHESTRAEELAREAKAFRKREKDKKWLLAFGDAEDEQFAVPLNQVVRIEEISAADVEDVGGKKVMQYRGRNLLLFAIDQVARVTSLAGKDPLLVLVFMLAGREIGLLAAGPIDAVEVTVKPDEMALKQPGIAGSIIINGRTTLLVDIFDIVQTLNPHWFAGKDGLDETDDTSARILIAEDSNFFRDQVKGFIEAAGYHVIAAEDGLEAWNLLQKHGDRIRMVVTDIEMPNLDGFALAGKIKSDARYAHLPIIALTTLAEDKDIARGKEVGIDDYQIKLDREQLMDGIKRFMGKI